jgi:hypothetical protein
MCLKEVYMFQVTEKADKMIQQFFEGKDKIEPIRIFLSQGG